MMNGTGFEELDQSMNHLSLGAEGAQSGQNEGSQGNFAQQSSSQPQDDPMSRYRVFIGGISWKATEQDLGQFFSQFGNVIDCKIIFDKVTHKSKGYGFITFDSEESVVKVLQAKQANAASLAIFGKAMDVGHAVRRNSPIDDSNAPKQHNFHQGGQRGGYGGYQQRQFNAGRFAPGGYAQQNFRGGRGRGNFQPGGQYIDPQAYGRQGSYAYGQQPFVDPNQQWPGYGKGNVGGRQQQQFRNQQQLQQQYWQGQVAAQAQARPYGSTVPGQYDATNASPYYAGVGQTVDDVAAQAQAVQSFGAGFGLGQTTGGYAPAFATYGADGL